MGEVLSRAEVELRYPKGDVGVYCLSISSNSFIDSALFRGVGSFANASRGKTKPNARFVCNPADSSVRLVAINCSGGGDFCLLRATILEGVSLSHYVWYS